MPINETTGWIITIIKTTWYISAITFFEYLWIINTQFYILWILMVVDFISWVAKQYVIKPQWITSFKASIWVIKKVLLLLVVLSIALMLKWIWINAEHYLSWIISILIVAETYSTIQNTYTVISWQILPEYDVISILLKKISNWIQNFLEWSLNEIEFNKKEEWEK